MISTKTRILVISNEALSQSTSNGRTLSNFLLKIPAANIAQFYLHGTPDKSICANHYRVSDKDALNAFLFKKVKPVINAQGNTVQKSVSPVKENNMERSCRNLVLRDIVWRSYRWWTKEFTSFIKEFNPSVLLFQAGDMPFMFLIAMKIAKKYNIPIIMYNSENYVLKEKLYSGVNPKSVWHKILQHSLKSVYKKIMKAISYCIYSTEYLEQSYQAVYPHPNKSTAFYTVSDMKPLEDKSNDDIFTLLYCGNLGVGRAKPLYEIAKILNKVNPEAKLQIYGKFVNEKEKNAVCSVSNVEYGGVVPYSQVPELMSKASMIIHCENDERLENLKGAFSTKIADSLASSRPFLVYALREYPFVEYLIKNDCAHIASTKEELEEVITKCIENKEYRYKYVKNAVCTAQRNHSIEVNCTKMEDILKCAVE